MKKKAVVIGSGVAGMATAIRLAIKGFDVSVYEKNNYPGGKINSFVQDGYSFDAGPSLFTQPENIEELFNLAGDPIEKYFSYEPVDIACKYFYENGKIINAYTDPQKFSRELQEQLGESPATVNRYLARSRNLYNNIGSVFLNFSLHKKTTWLHRRIIKALSAIRPGYLLHSLHKYNKRAFSSAEAVQLFDRFATYNGSDPYKAPAMLSLIPHLEHNQGVFYPQGGMISITNALYQLAKTKGVNFYFNVTVQQIIHTNNKVNGIIVDNENIQADIVVSNSDVYFTYKNLLRNQAKAAKIIKQERSSSALIFYWGIKKSFPQLELHNIFFTSNYRDEFDAIFNKGTATADPTIYINITSKMESTQAPSGSENWFVMINVPANTGQDWTYIKQTARKHIMAKLSRLLAVELEPLIETEGTLDPVLIEQQTLSYMGSLYGSSSNSKMAAFLRQANFTDAIKGLYFCGGSVHPGGGIPLCLKSAKIVSELIIQ